MDKTKLRLFMHNNSVFFILGGSLLITHWAWFRLQENELFVPRELNKGHPFMHADTRQKFINKIKGWLPGGGSNNEPSESDS